MAAPDETDAEVRRRRQEQRARAELDRRREKERARAEEQQIIGDDRTQDDLSPRAKSSGKGKKTADKWNQ